MGNIERRVCYLSLGMVAILGLLSLLWYRERMLFTDPAFVLFGIINSGGFVFSEHRYGAFVTQMWPLVASYIHLPLDMVLGLYSLSFYLFFGGIIAWVALKWKQFRWATLLALYLCLFVSDTFFWPTNEVHQGMGWMILFFATFQFYSARSKFSLGVGVAILVLGFLATNCHLLVLLPMSYLWISLLLEKEMYSSTRKKIALVYTSIVLLGFALLRYVWSQTSWYDGEKLAGVKNLDFFQVKGTLLSGQSLSFVQEFVSSYWTCIPIIFLGMSALLRKKKYVQLAVFLSFITVYYLMVCTTFPEAFGRTQLYYFESEWMALSLILSWPFVRYFDFDKNPWIVYLVGMVFLIRLGYIYRGYHYYHQRMDTVAEWMDRTASRGDQILLEDDVDLQDALGVSWGLPVETMILSSLKGPQGTRTLKIMGQPHEAVIAQDSFFSSFRKQSKSWLNPAYFHLDSTSNYQVLSKDVFQYKE